MMKKHLYLITFLSVALFSMVPTVVSGAIKPQYGFEDKVPSFIRLDGDGELGLTDHKFKEGKKSLCVEWQSGAKLIFDNAELIKKSILVDGAGVMMWIYCPEMIADTLTFTLFDSKDEVICYFDFYMGYTGWRAAWMKYEDMLTKDGYYGSVKIPAALVPYFGAESIAPKA